MKRILSLSAGAVAFLLLTGGTGAQTVATDPVGFTTSTCPANSDTLLSVPFTRPPEFVGATASATANTITVPGNPWTVNQFVYVAGSQPKTYFVLIGPHTSSNPKEGNMYQITSNTTNTSDLEYWHRRREHHCGANSDPGHSLCHPRQCLPGFGCRDFLHCLAFRLQSADANFDSELRRRWNQPRAEPSPTFSSMEPGGGLATRLTEDHGDDPFTNAGYFTLRNASTGTTLTTLGSVLTKNTTIPLFTRVGATSVQQDNFVSVIRPIDVTLNDLGLITSGAFLSSPSAVQSH